MSKVSNSVFTTHHPLFKLNLNQTKTQRMISTVTASTQSKFPEYKVNIDHLMETFRRNNLPHQLWQTGGNRVLGWGFNPLNMFIHMRHWWTHPSCSLCPRSGVRCPRPSPHRLGLLLQPSQIIMSGKDFSENQYYLLSTYFKYIYQYLVIVRHCFIYIIQFR